MSKKRDSREFDYTPADFSQVQNLIMDRVGIHLGDNKSQMVYSRLARRLRATGETSVKRYLAQLEDSQHPEWQNFINALTTNLTAFFREKHHFDTLVEYFAGHDPRQPLVIWCCAASTGEEPYSIVIALREAFGASRPIEVIASDVDTQALATARAGVYPVDRVAKLEPALLRKYFQKGRGARQGQARVKPEIRHCISFRQINLLEPGWNMDGPLDAIFCRNVFIYFRPETQKQLLRRFRGLMAPDGLFFAGHSESLISSGEGFRSLGRTVFTPGGA